LRYLYKLLEHQRLQPPRFLTSIAWASSSSQSLVWGAAVRVATRFQNGACYIYDLQNRHQNALVCFIHNKRFRVMQAQLQQL